MPIPPSLDIPRICFVAALTSWPTLVPNRIEDFDGLSC